MRQPGSILAIIVMTIFRTALGSTEARWKTVRPLRKSLFQFSSAGKSRTGECFTFSAVIEAPRNTTKVNRDSSLTIIAGENTQTPNYKLVIDTGGYCRETADVLKSGSESIVMLWSDSADVTLQTVFPLNNCELHILRQESSTQISFKAFIKSCYGNYTFNPKIGVKDRRVWNMTDNVGEYFRQDDAEVVTTAGELQGATSISAHFDKLALRKDDMRLKSLTFRVYMRHGNSGVLDIIWIINLLSVF